MQWRNSHQHFQLFGRVWRTPGAQISIQTRSGRTRGMGVHSITFAITKWMRTTVFNNARVLAGQRSAKRFRRNVWWSVLIPGVTRARTERSSFFLRGGPAASSASGGHAVGSRQHLRSTAPLPSPVLNAFPLPNDLNRRPTWRCSGCLFAPAQFLECNRHPQDQMLGSKWRAF